MRPTSNHPGNTPPTKAVPADGNLAFDQLYRKNAARVLRKILAATRNLTRFPRIGRVVPELRHSSIRELIVFNYRVIYRVREDNVTIGAGARILGNVTIGDNCRVGAGFVVLRDVGPNSTIVGVPGHIVLRDGKRVIITHSEIFPGTFASTTETADYLLAQLG